MSSKSLKKSGGKNKKKQTNLKKKYGWKKEGKNIKKVAKKKVGV